jgi:hypothetical protein
MSVLLIGQELAIEQTELVPATGQVRAYRLEATKSGTIEALTFKTAKAGTCTSLVVGIMEDLAGVPHPAGLIEEKTITEKTKEAKTILTATGFHYSVTAGTFYWLFILPLGGNIKFWSESESPEEGYKQSSNTTPSKVTKVTEVLVWGEEGEKGASYLAGLGTESAPSGVVKLHTHLQAVQRSAVW